MQVLKKYPWLIAFWSLAALRLTCLIPYIIDDDEAWWVVAARTLTAPGNYYFQAVDHKPPGIVWFYWFIEKLLHVSVDPRATRFVFLLLTILSALTLGWMAKKFADLVDHKERQHDSLIWKCGSFYLLATAIGSPKLITVTADGLLLVFLIFSYAIALFSHFRGAFVISGCFLAIALLVKQTAIFFIIPILISRWPRRWNSAALFEFIMGGAIIYLPAIFSLDFQEFIYWNWTYPSEVLTMARSEAFNSNSEFLSSLLQFYLALFPLCLFAIKARISVSGFRFFRDFRVTWLAAGTAAMLMGRGIFLHYFLLIIPPLVLLSLDGYKNQKSFQRPGLAWLGLTYFLACVVHMIPSSGLFWGNDLAYYETIGRKLNQLVRPDQTVLVWGGSALPLTYSGANYPTRFLLPRFAEPPYDTIKTQAFFHEELKQSPPALIVDLHDRGDNRFNNPFETDPFIAKMVKNNYSAYFVLGLPWVRFYLASPPPKEAGLIPVLPERPTRQRTELVHFNSLSFHSILNIYKQALTQIPKASFLEKAFHLDWSLRARASLDLILKQTSSTQILREGQILEKRIAQSQPSYDLYKEVDLFFKDLSKSNNIEVPFAWRSGLWWLHSAVVEMQPKLYHEMLWTK